MIKLVALFALLALIFAEQQQCDFDESKAEKIGKTSRSGKGPGDTSEARCMTGYQMVGCECESFPSRDDCDGARIREDATGTTCIAYHMTGGKGVVARPRCQKVMVTCQTSVTNMPSIRCPENYKLAGCTMHSSFRHKLWQGNPGGNHPVSKRGDGGPCPAGKVDVVFVMDSSGSMGSSGWAAAKSFANRIVDAVPVGADKAQFAFVQFSSGLQHVFNLDTHTTAADITSAITAISGPGGWTLTNLGLDKAKEILFNAAAGARDAAEKLVVVLTDGYSSSPAATAISAAALRDEGVTILAVGAGGGVNVDELNNMAGNTDQVLQSAEVDTVHLDNFIHDQIVAHITCLGLCYTTEGCESCSVRARCVRVDSVLPNPLP